jgi:hypothetical protein
MTYEILSTGGVFLFVFIGGLFLGWGLRELK